MDTPPPLPAHLPPAPGLTSSVRAFLKPFALSFKVGGILVLVLLLQIPLLMVRGLLHERYQRRDEAVQEITTAWGRSQTLVGPILVVPYRTLRTVEKEVLVNDRAVRTTEERMGDAYAFFLPEELSVVAQIGPSIRSRGIYDAVVYTSAVTLSGRFAAPDLKALGLAPESLQWNRAWLALGISDLRGTRDTVKLVWGGQTVPLSPGARIEDFGSGLHALLPINTAPSESVTFSIDLALNGSTSLSFAPLGIRTTARVASSWADPSFSGAFLPSERELTPAGFNAVWRIPYYARNYAQHWTNLADQPRINLESLSNSYFGVDLVRPVDSYRAVERATKHGALFITLLFTAFFLFEVLASLRLHALHYLLVGAALCLFYLGLLSLSEFVSFDAAYLASASGSTLLIGAYCRAILRTGTRALTITAALAGIYGLLYFVLQMQDYALLAGTGALFVVLAVVMYTTRNVDWSNQATTNPTTR